MTLDPGAVQFYQNQCHQRISELIEKLTKDIPEDETSRIRAEIRCYRAVISWKPQIPSTDNGVSFFT